jgi:iron complex outermembrane recepter protein
MNVKKMMRVFRRLGYVVAVVAAAQTKAQEGLALPKVEVHGRVDKSVLLLDLPSASGSRTGISARELPASVETLSSRTILERGDYATRDAIGRTTGIIDIASPGDGGMSFSARGFTGTDSVGLAEDGARLAVAAGTQTYPTDSWGYDRIEVLRGPASVVFGSGTVGATINAIRKAPRREFGVEGLVGLGDHENVRVGVGATGPLGDSLSYRIDAYAKSDAGVRDLTRSRGHALLTTLRWDASDALRFDLLADYSYQKPQNYWGTPLVNGTVDKALRDQNYNVGDGIIWYEDKRLRGRVQWQASAELSVRDEAYLLQADRRWRNVEQYRLDPATRQVTRTDYLEILHAQRQRGNRIELLANLRGHDLIGGWDATSIDFQHTNNSPFGGSSTVADRGFDHGLWASPDPTLPKYKTDTTVHAVYVEDAYRLNEQVLLLGGVRHDRFHVARTPLVPDTPFDRRLSGTALRLGATYKFDAATNVYAQLSSGHDPVTSLVTLNLGNADFRMAKGRQIELGIKQRLPAETGDWTAAVYRIDKSDIITQDPNNPAISIQGGRQHSQGIEFTASVAPNPTLRIDANLALLDAKFDELRDDTGASQAGNRPPNVPALTANLWGQIKQGAWQASLGVRHVAKRYGNNSNTLALPAYSVFDAALGWSMNQALRVRALVHNLADSTYAIVTYGSNQAVLGERRRFELVAEYGF